VSAAKRAIDIAGAAVGLLILAPLLVLLAVAVRATSRGAPLLRQRRAGRGGREFRMWKFRTMISGAEGMRPLLMEASRDGDWLLLDRDPRITRLGRALRRTSLDELPQLVNVLHGDMSLVGPRPLPVEEHSRIPSWALPRTDVRPGMTGLWQIRGRTRLGFTQMLELDCEYVRAPSLRADLRILAATVPALLTAKGAN
jgi:lipopolysaccharide/colanic/teichoic acid biosynthesis glycosyltransferase